MKTKQELWQAAVSAVFALTAAAAAAVLVHREFFVAPAVRTAGVSSMPTFVRDWEKLKGNSILVGNADAKVQIVEFADFECPVCRGFDQRLNAVVTKRPGAVAVLFVHFPLPQHRFARPAAKASECAVGQSRFAAFASALYARQDSLGLKSWSSYARDAKVPDIAAFERCVADTTSVRRIDQGLAIGAEIGVHGTPTILINGWRFPATPSEEQILKAVDAIMAGNEPFKQQAGSG